MSNGSCDGCTSTLEDGALDGYCERCVYEVMVEMDEENEDKRREYQADEDHREIRWAQR